MYFSRQNVCHIFQPHSNSLDPLVHKCMKPWKLSGISFSYGSVPVPIQTIVLMAHTQAVSTPYETQLLKSWTGHEVSGRRVLLLFSPKAIQLSYIFANTLLTQILVQHPGPSLWPVKLRSYQSIEPLPINLQCETSNKTAWKIKNDS